ncbi:AAA family ATPase [Paraburkholderia tropica]|uniref:AAA family ATPase n=1 Tax=Paraburkholderia tropica TaxID=92647 RepID=UPI002AB123D4|nr:AAA family ATPase [Paraburkholderia tropica]
MRDDLSLTVFEALATSCGDPICADRAPYFELEQCPLRLVTLKLQNFRGYTDRKFTLHPQFNLIVGVNGSGKTSLLEAAAVAIGSWFLGIRGYDSRNIRPRDVRVVREFVEKRYRELPQYPVEVSAEGMLTIAKAGRNGDSGQVEISDGAKERLVSWARSVDGPGGRTTQADAKTLKKIAEATAKSILNSEPRILPLIRYFGAGRLWESVRDSNGKTLSKYRGKQPGELASEDLLDELLAEGEALARPFYGYRLSVDKRCNPDDLIRWMAYERRNELDEDEQSPALRLVYKAVESMLPNAISARYSVKLRTLIIRLSDNRFFSFEELSDGYRNVVAIAADLAIKAAMLNPSLAEKALELTPGVVLIDELDLHLHPIWQREIVEALRRTFPRLQFICTTHSPFLIQSLRSGAELIVLDGQPTADVANMTLEDIAQGLMGVNDADVSQRYREMKGVARQYLETLENAAMEPEEKLADFKQRLADSIAPYADNPAFQAFLEMKRAATKLGD